MKCDELKTVCYIDAYSTMPVYCAKEVDESIAELKADLRKTQRALWLARAKNCKWAALYFWYGYTDKPKSIRYEKAEAKCFKKAEEYE